MATRPAYHYSEQDVKQRVRALRHLLEGSDHGSKTVFAQRMGIDADVWNTVERGYPVSRSVAFALALNYPQWVSLDWIYFGRTDGMSTAFLEELGRAEAELIRLDAVASQNDFYPDGSDKRKRRAKSRA